MVAKKNKSGRNEGGRPAPAVPARWDRGLLMLLLGVLCYTTAIAFDTTIHGTFDLSKLGFLYAVVLLLIVGAAGRLLFTGELRLPRTPLDGPLLAILLAAALTTALSVDWRCSLFGAYKTYEGFFQIAAYVVVLLAASRLRRREVVVVIGVLLLAAFGAGMYGFLQRFGDDPLGWSKTIARREISTFGNPVFFGMYVAMMVPAAVGLALRDRRQAEGNRSAALWWLGAAVASAIVCMSTYPQLQTFRGAQSLGTGVKVAALVVAAVALTAALGHRMLLRSRPSGWSTAQGWWAVAVAVVVNAALYWNRTVGALVALVFALAWFAAHMLLFDRDSWRRNRRRWIVLGLALAAVNIGLNLWPETSTTGRIDRLIFRKVAASSAAAEDAAPQRELAPAGSLYKRMLLWRSGINIIREHPLLGVGPDAIERVIATHWAADYQLRHDQLVEVEGFENRLHNELLELWASQGAVGVAARTWLYVAFLVMLWRGARREEAGEQAVLAGLGATWVLLIACNVFEYPTIPISAAFWTVMGLTVAWIHNRGDRAQWPSRTIRLPGSPNPLLAALLLAGVTALALWFWQIALHRPYSADRHFMMAQYLIKRNELAPARDEFQKAILLEPNLHVYRESLNATLTRMGGALSTASGEAQRLRGEEISHEIIDNANESIARAGWRANGHAYLATGQELLADFLQKAPPPVDSSRITELRKSAEAELQRSVQLNPWNAGLRTIQARFFLKHGMWEQLHAAAEATLGLWPKNGQVPDLVLQAASTMLQEKKGDEAESFLLLLKDTPQPERQLKVWEGLGRAYWLGQKWDQLEEAGREMVARDPASQHGWRFLTVAQTQLGRLDEALASGKRLLELHPDDDYGRWLLNTIRSLRAKGQSAAPDHGADAAAAG